jgi:S-DNA-T family DNA segregation ATPase FtsK/SpoIIIE
MSSKIKNKDEKEKTGSKTRKKRIIGILFIVISFLIFLSIISYTARDEANADIKFGDLFKLIFGPDAKLQAKADTTKNWLGIAGAIISNFLITSVIGYFSIIFPILSGAWGWCVLRSKDTKKIIYITNICLIFGLLLATFIGLLKSIPLFSIFNTQWCGAIGAFVANSLIRLIGTLGGIILTMTAFFLMLIVTIDLDLHQTFLRIKLLTNKIKGWWLKKKGTESDSEKIIPSSDDEISEKVPIKKQIETKNIVKQQPIFQEIEEDNIEDSEQKIEKTSELEIKNEKFEPKVFYNTKNEISIKKEDVKTQKVSHSEEKGEMAEEEEEIEYIFPTTDLLDIPKQHTTVSEYEISRNKENLIEKLQEFGIVIKDEDISVQVGPVFSLYEVIPPEKVKISQIVSLSDDIQLALEAKRIRIIAPMPGKGTVGIEISNKNPSNVYFREIINSKQFKEAKFALPIAMGRTTVAMEKTTTGEIFCADLASIPHLLIAGATGSGKSIGINTIIASILYKMAPTDVKLVFIDPKKVELKLYEKLKNHFLARCPDIVDEDIITTPQNAIIVLRSLVKEMEIRYDKLAKCGVRNVKDYNEKVRKGEIVIHDNTKPKKLPYIVVIIDELADLMITAAKEVEEPIARIAQLARAVGIHLVIATQRPSVDVITGTIKANFAARIAYQVASTTDSRTILNMNGAEDLIGKGDMLFLSSMSPKPVRIQNAYISTEEVEKIVDFIGNQKGGSSGPFDLPSLVEKKKGDGNGRGGVYEYDELFDEAARLIVRHQQGSVSLVQRRLKVGYSRAARIIDEMEMTGIVGPFDGSKARAVLIETEEELNEILNNL